MIKNMKQRLKNQKGLTLIELLAVIVILGIISAIAIPSIGKIIENSKIDAIKADAIQIINSAKIYYTETGDATITLTELEANHIELTTNFTNTTVTVTDGTFTIDATGEKDSTSVTFTDATIDDIDGADKGDKTIGTASPVQGGTNQ